MGREKMLALLSSFSKEEWAMNGHRKEDLPAILNIFSSLLPYIKEGRFLELGCGTGILCKFITLFSDKKIIPYGVDIRPDAVLVAKRNNRKYLKNFYVGDYFTLDYAAFSKFSTIIIFVSSDRPWDRVKTLADSLVGGGKCDTLIIFCYEHNFSNDAAALGLAGNLEKYSCRISSTAKFIVAQKPPRIKRMAAA